jgi:LAO/AO transport system kinase
MTARKDAPPPLPDDPAGLAARVLEGDRRAVARAITRVENRERSAEALLAALFPKTGRAFRVGVTGAPGAGKSTLVNAIAQHLRKEKRRVAIVAVDPSSPFTGGALLGDRVRMLSLDPDVYIRSMSSRGHLGGIAAATDDVCDVLDAAGFDPILVETVGVGQSEVEIATATDATVIVVTPESGDSIQTLKAGILEAADVIVVNKADRDGAAELQGEIEASLALRAESPSGWTVPVRLASAARSRSFALGRRVGGGGTASGRARARRGPDDLAPRRRARAPRRHRRRSRRAGDPPGVTSRDPDPARIGNP